MPKVIRPRTIVSSRPPPHNHATPRQKPGRCAFEHQPKLIVEDPEDGSPLECLCGSAVLSAWEVRHEGPDGEICSIQSCDNCWTQWLNSNLHRHNDLWSVSCICNRARVSLDSLRVVLRPKEFHKQVKVNIVTLYLLTTSRLCDRAAMATANRLRNWISCPVGSCTYGHEHDISVDGLQWYCQREGCGMVACASCRSPWHEGRTCREYQRLTLREGFTSLTVEENGHTSMEVKECPRCHHALYKIGGCDHMTCVCGHEFCYLCCRRYLRASSISSVMLIRHSTTCGHWNPDMEGFRIHGIDLENLCMAKWKLEFVDASASVKITLQSGQTTAGHQDIRMTRESL